MRDETSELTPDLLLHAYASGVFPMAESQDDDEVFWVDPKRRGIFPLDGFHMSRSLIKRMRRGDRRVTFNADFAGVVQGCAARNETWINTTIFELYLALHHMGFAHSVEVWQDDALIGGTYGVALGGAYFGESMFSRDTDASKMALAWLIDKLRSEGFQLFDTQFLTPHLASLGAIEVSRADYRSRLASALLKEAMFRTDTPVASAQDVIQRNTQTS